MLITYKIIEFILIMMILYKRDGLFINNLNNFINFNEINTKK